MENAGNLGMRPEGQAEAGAANRHVPGFMTVCADLHSPAPTLRVKFVSLRPKVGDDPADWFALSHVEAI